MKMVVKMINPKLDEKILDSSCGTGGFLVNAMNHVIKQVEMDYVKDIGTEKSNWSDDELLAFRNKISDMASENFFGFDINPDLVKATKMNMVMNNDGSGNILQCNTLLPPHEWSSDFKKQLAKALGVKEGEIRNKDTLGFFDVIVTNPPFGSKIPIKDKNILEQFEIAYIWEEDKENKIWSKTDRLQTSVSPEILFIERCIQLLKPKGRLGIVLPDSILGSPGLGYIRTWLIENTKIIASIDLHVDTFQPRNGTQTSVLILQKKTELEKQKEIKEHSIEDYNIFMAMVEKVGQDRRGTPLFKKDDEGNDILVPDLDNIIFEELADGTKTAKRQQMKKERDDQTIIVPDIFKQWKFNEGIQW